MLKEFCAENLKNVREAVLAGAGRVELCDDLSVGGVTPSDLVIKDATALVHSLGARLMVMVRPRGGDFAYGEDELKVMEATITRARELGADGVVFGCVVDGELDVPATRRLARAAQGLVAAAVDRQAVASRKLDMTFHMAFDEIRPDLQKEALNTLARMGFSRVLTHGGPLSRPIDACLPHLKELAETAREAGKTTGHTIAIMPGGGVTWENVEQICDELGATEAHGTRIVAW